MATVQIDEQNGTAPGVTQPDITNTNMGSVDAPNLDPVANPVTPGNNTFEKWQNFNITDMAGSSKVDNLKVWRTDPLGGAAVHVTNARETAYVATTVFATPISTASAVATQTMPETVPAGANLGIGGLLTGLLIAPGTSDFLVHQIQTNAADTAGSTSTMNYQFDDTA